MKTYANATPYERLTMPTPAENDPYWCSTQTVSSWVDLYQSCHYSNDELQTQLHQLIDGEYVPTYTCEIPLRIAALKELLGIVEAPKGYVCPACAARERKKLKLVDADQTSLFV